jgi:hypothetical protein
MKSFTKVENGVYVGIDKGNTVMKRILFSRQNLYAVLLVIILFSIIVMTSDQSPQWIYQGF